MPKTHSTLYPIRESPPFPLAQARGSRTETHPPHSVSTVRSAIELKQVFERLQQAEAAGLSQDQMRKLEEQAAEQGMRTLWKVRPCSAGGVMHVKAGRPCSSSLVCCHDMPALRSHPRYCSDAADARVQGAKLEVEAVVRDTCEQILTEPGVPKDKLVLRAVALELAAEAFLSIKKEGEQGQGPDDFVKIETPASKGRPPQPPPRPTAAPPSVPPRPAVPPQAEGQGQGQGQQETLHAAYKACESYYISTEIEHR